MAVPLTLLITLIFLASAIDALVVLRSKTSVKSTSAAEVQNFIATTSNWPKIVLSSVAVEGSNCDKPLKRGETVKEVFGFPPIIPLDVEWKCVENDLSTGTLNVFSEQGLAGVASNCRMLFDIQPYEGTGCTVDLEMSYEPQSPLAVLAQPVLSVDNAFALKVLLPAAIQSISTSEEENSNIDKFRQLMGTLYGFAGLAHAADILGPNLLFEKFGIPPFAELPLGGQVLAVIWCLSGGLSYALSRSQNALLADVGIIQYGLVEVSGSFLSNQYFNSDLTAAALQNAVLIQPIVAASWLYSKSKKEE
ncbi:unnamed protein product [Heterosigma akashiwo]|uniref:Uncharacterized protein n=1 Tax=Heterosigma akashiwo TaxID=2829 RepID=A0A6V1VGL6_HETAK|mmetsp:Transcript_28311/g.44579  ORF Transcript_28311/g.44579 Transcript_28311/m.44579 type:complete len:306 (-) Transcript_28311:324-1241(-)